MSYYGFNFILLYDLLESPGGNHECAGLHNGGNVDRSIGRDLPHSSVGGRTGAYCLELVTLVTYFGL